MCNEGLNFRFVWIWRYLNLKFFSKKKLKNRKFTRNTRNIFWVRKKIFENYKQKGSSQNKRISQNKHTFFGLMKMCFLFGHSILIIKGKTKTKQIIVHAVEKFSINYNCPYINRDHSLCTVSYGPYGYTWGHSKTLSNCDGLWGYFGPQLKIILSEWSLGVTSMKFLLRPTTSSLWVKLI